MISVVVPACNESAVIARTLRSILASNCREKVEIVVVCNGCTDDTAEVARSFGEAVTVVETEAPGKVGALNLGDSVATGFPRFYVDADVELHPAVIQDVASALDGDILAASPALRLDMSRSSLAVRAYLAVWQRLPQVRLSLAGRGIYALSAAGHERLGRFPDVVNDDGFVDALFADARAVVPHVASIVRAPRTTRQLIHRRVRVVVGNTELRRLGVLRSKEVSRFGWWHATRGEPRLFPALAVYLPLTFVVRLLVAGRILRGGAVTWNRDESDRDRATHAA